MPRRDVRIHSDSVFEIKLNLACELGMLRKDRFNPVKHLGYLPLRPFFLPFPHRLHIAFSSI